MKKFNIMKWFMLIPSLAPFPEGYAVGLAIARELHWNIGFVIISAIVVAGTGFYGVQVMNRLSEFNATILRDEKNLELQVPTWKAWVVLGVWFAGVTMITVFLDTVPLLKTLTPLALVVIGFSASNLYALSNIVEQHEELRDKHRVTKEKEKEVSRNEKIAERKERQAKAQQLATMKQAIAEKMQAVQPGKHSKTGSKLTPEMLLLEWAGNPSLTPTEMVDVLWNDGKGIKVTRQAISQRRDAMEKAGIIVIGTNGEVMQPITPFVGQTIKME